MKRYVICGGPCCGKSTTIMALKKGGGIICEEAATYLLKTKFNGENSKGVDRDTFQREIFALQEKHYEKSGKEIFFDRGFGDTLAYYLFDGLDIPEDLMKIAKMKRYDKIFFLLPLDFFENNTVRPESQKEGEKISDFIRKVYRDLGYDIVEVPFMSVEERVKFIRGHLG